MFDSEERLITHDLAVQLTRFRSKNDMRARPVSKTQGMDSYARPRLTSLDVNDEALPEMAGKVADLLPWRNRDTDEPVDMRVVGAGRLDRPHRLFPVGTPYVLIAVGSWPAAEAIHRALRPIARLDEASWAIDWWQSRDAFREIKIFPDPSEYQLEIGL
jgi:hypothetical protein